jgi:CheY-like chemotaxis protein
MYNSKIFDPEQKYKQSFKRLNILIVDDDENSRYSLRDLIKIRGHNVITLDEGMKCVNRCSDNIFDIIFMDYHINDLEGEVTGIEITNIIRDCFNNESIIYAYTGDNSTEAINEFKSNNMKGVFIKPIEPLLLNEFFMVIEKNIDDFKQLSKLSLKRKNFKYFGKLCS